MNKNNAETIGRNDGASALLEIERDGRDISAIDFTRIGNQVARAVSRVVETQARYMQGWDSAYLPWRQRVDAERAPRPVVDHNPNTRFCSCPACMEPAVM